MIGILLIATGNYQQFVGQLIKSLGKNFMPDKKLIIYLFTDDIDVIYGKELIDFPRIYLLQIPIQSYKFPEATLFRYRIFLNRLEELKKCDYLFYLDVDMRVVAPVGDEMLADLVAVRHPGFDVKGGGSWEKNKFSFCYTENCKTYYAGGVQGGRSSIYIGAMQKMNKMINGDIANGIVPVWHDESAWNCYLSKQMGFKELDSSYCMVEQMHLRKQWGIDKKEPKIIALEKDHAKLRNNINEAKIVNLW